jgi:hypothetical protein
MSVTAGMAKPLNILMAPIITYLPSPGHSFQDVYMLSRMRVLDHESIIDKHVHETHKESRLTVQLLL